MFYLDLDRPGPDWGRRVAALVLALALMVLVAIALGSLSTVSATLAR